MFIAQKSFNVAVVFIAFILAIVATVKSQKPADEAKSSGDKKQKDIIFINNTAITASVLTAVLLLLALGVFHFTDKKIYLVKGILGIAVGITGGFLMGVGWFAYEDNKAEFAKIAIAAGIFILLAGSSSATLSLP